MYKQTDHTELDVCTMKGIKYQGERDWSRLEKISEGKRRTYALLSTIKIKKSINEFFKDLCYTDEGRLYEMKRLQNWSILKSGINEEECPLSEI